MVLRLKGEMNCANDLLHCDVITSFKYKLRLKSRGTVSKDQLGYCIYDIGVVASTSVGEAINHQTDAGKENKCDA